MIRLNAMNEGGGHGHRIQCDGRIRFEAMDMECVLGGETDVIGSEAMINEWRQHADAEVEAFRSERWIEVEAMVIGPEAMGRCGNNVWGLS